MTKTRVAVIAGVLLAAFITSAALAWWTTEGTGTGEATVDTPEEVTIEGGTVTSYLFPTNEAMGELSLTVTNPNVYELRIYEIELDTSAPEGVNGYSQNAVDCFVTFTDQTSVTPWVVPGTGSLDIDLVDSVTMGTAAPDSCQNEDFTIYVKTGDVDA